MTLLVDRDIRCGHTLAALLRRQGDIVHVVRNRSQAFQAMRRMRYDLAIVDLFVEGGGAELARDLARRIPQVVLSLGATLDDEDLLEAALGFPVHRKAVLPERLKASVASSSDGEFSATHPGSRRRVPGAIVPAPTLVSHGRRRGGRRSH
jgi:CheY-like chemotaxis protein